MTYNAVENSKIYNEGFLFEILINRLLGTGLDDRYPELSNLMYSEEGKLFIRTPDKYLKKTKNCLNKSLNLFIKNKIISSEKKILLSKLVSKVEESTHSSEISQIVSHALDITHEYIEA